MKIKQIMLKNFASVHSIEINLKDDVTYLIGTNGSGKTTVGLNAVWFILEGLAQTGKKVLHGERFRFVGDHGKSAVGQLILHDEIENIDVIITRKLTKDKTELKITASDKRQLPDNFIDDIFNIFSINPVGFSKLTPQEQALALGIDTAKFDALKKVAYDERTELGRDVKRLAAAVEEIGAVEKIEPVDLKKLLKEKEQIDAANAKAVEKARAERDEAVREAIEHNAEQDAMSARLKDAAAEIERAEDRAHELREKIKELETSIKEILAIHKKRIAERDQLPTPADKKSTDIPINLPKTESTVTLANQIESAEATNKKAALYQQKLDAIKKYTKADTKYLEKRAEMNKLEVDRIEYVKSCNLPFSAITIDDAGGVLINDRPFSETYFSKGEILRIGIKLAAASDPKLKYIYVPDSQSIDKENREKLFTELVEAGFQVVAEYVDTERQKDHGSILLKESKVVETYDEEENKLDEL